MLQNGTLESLKSLALEFEGGNTALLSEDDIVALSDLCHSGFGNNNILDIVNDKNLFEKIKANKLYSVTFDDDDIESIKKCIELRGKDPNISIGIDNGKNDKGEFISCTFAPGEITGAVLLDNHSVAIFRRGIENPSYLRFYDGKSAKLVYSRLANDISSI